MLSWIQFFYSYITQNGNQLLIFGPKIKGLLKNCVGVQNERLSHEQQMWRVKLGLNLLKAQASREFSSKLRFPFMKN